MGLGEGVEGGVGGVLIGRWGEREVVRDGGGGVKGVGEEMGGELEVWMELEGGGVEG